MGTTEDARLFEPLQIRRWRLKNRIVMPPMVTVRDITKPDGVEWYERHAAGGPGLVIIEATGVPRFGCDITVETLRPVVDAIHAHDAVAAIQLFPVTIGRQVTVDTIGREEIGQIVDQYRVAASICLQAGMDGVEPHGAHGYLLNRFFSPAENSRSDDYGGSLENRMRLGLGIVDSIVSETGGELMLLYRHTPVQQDSYGLEDSLAFARQLAAAGVDVLDLSPSSDAAPGDLSAPFMGLGASVITVGAMADPGRAAEALRAQRADLIAVGRGLIADPDWPEKVAAGGWDAVVQCIKCNELCFGNLRRRVPIACTQW